MSNTETTAVAEASFPSLPALRARPASCRDVTGPPPPPASQSSGTGG